jgi:nucleoside-diphosphate-sugar epimerase
MRIFVTGATGVVGIRAVPLLRAQAHEVTALARSPEKRAVLERLGAHPVTLDLFDASAVGRAVEGHDVVVNLATHIPSPTYRMALPWAWRENDRIRSQASGILADAAIAAGVQRFVQESFAPVYPDRGEDWIDESVAIQPSRYNRSVGDAERSAQRFTESGRTGVVLRFAFFYGPDSGATRDVVRSAGKGRAGMPGRSEAFISSVSHDDAAAAVVAALNVPAGAYNVTDDEPLRRRDYFDALAAALNVPPLKLMPPWATRLMGAVGEMLDRSLRISNRKLTNASDWRPRYPSMREGWAATIREME